MKEIKANKWKDVPHSRIGKIKAMYKLHATPIKTPISVFTETEKQSSNACGTTEDPK